jgi:hypothetical protein
VLRADARLAQRIAGQQSKKMGKMESEGVSHF